MWRIVVRVLGVAVIPAVVAALVAVGVPAERVAQECVAAAQLRTP